MKCFQEVIVKKAVVILFLLTFLIVSAGVIGAHHNRLPGNTWTTGQQVQNIGNSSTTVQLIAYNLLGDSYSCSTRSLNPGQSFTYLSDGTECDVMPVGFHGSGVVRSDLPLAVIVNTANKGFGSAAGQYVGTDVNDASTIIAFPLVKNNHYGRTTTFLVQNTSDNTNDLTAVFKVSGVTYITNLNNVPPKSTVVINPKDAAVPSGNGSVGSLTVTGTQTLAGVSLEHETFPNGEPLNLQSSRSFVSSDYSDGLFCPLVRHKFGSKLATSGIQVQNVGTENINITVDYEINIGSTKPGRDPVTKVDIEPGSSANFLQSEDFDENPGGNPRGTLGSAVITAENSDEDETAPVLIAAIVNDKAEGTTPERVTTYACFNEGNASTKINLPLVKELFYGNTSGIQVQNLGLSSTQTEADLSNQYRKNSRY